MASRLALALVVIAAACGCSRSAEPSARERLLAQLPGDAIDVAVADGPALASPRIRAALDALAAAWPASMGCVLEAALAADQAAVSVDGGRNVLVVVAAASVPACPALSQRTPGWWVATIGAGPAKGPTTVADDARFARARPYLTTAPIALVSLDGIHAIATAQPEPFDAWMTIDSPDGAKGAAAIEAAWSVGLTHLRADPAAAGVASRVRVSRSDAQVVVRLDGSAGGSGSAAEIDLAAFARGALAWVEAGGAEATKNPSHIAACPGGACPPANHRVASLSAALPLIVSTGRPSLVVSDGTVTGLRLGAAVSELGLDAGDVVIAVAGRPVDSRAMFLRLAAQVHSEASLTVRRNGGGDADRDGQETQVNFVEQ